MPPVVALGASCLKSEQCVPNARCSSRGFCECESGRIATGGECLLRPREVRPGGSCSPRDFCLGNSGCLRGVCTCPSSRPSLQDGECRPEAEVSTNHSAHSSTPVRLHDFVRVFPLNRQTAQTPAFGGMLGEFCDGFGADCAVENAVCAQHVCQCSPQFVQAGPLCIHRAKIANRVVDPNGACGAGSFCDGGSICSPKRTCQCPDGTFAYGRHGLEGDEMDGPPRRKIVKKSPGTPCRENPDICTGGSYCYNGYCVCPTGYEERDGGSEPGQSCDRPLNSIAVVECTGNSVCANGFCVCPNGEPIQNHVCVTVNTIAQPGEPCIVNVTRCLGTSFCSPEAGICCCPQKQVFLNGQCARVTVVSPLPMQSCTPPPLCAKGTPTARAAFAAACRGPSSRKPRNVCQPIILGTPMRINVSPGQACGSGVGCSSGAACLSGVCVCVNGQQVYNGRCVNGETATTRSPLLSGPIAAPGDSCTAPGTVCTGNSRCVQGFCACDPGFQAIAGQCCPAQPPVPDSSDGLMPGQTCDPRCEYLANCLQRCSGGSVCVDGICTCPDGQQALDGRLCARPAHSYRRKQDPFTITTTLSPVRRTARPSESCDFSVTCLGGSSCVLGICQCPRGFSPASISSAA
ncbi:hypothetical protein M3Y99_00058500 [Aphelenchoides fujianensis]|nr:hypothetical protein M3Y99_00058500 [Aphelenchoides fujianensis]